MKLPAFCVLLVATMLPPAAIGPKLGRLFFTPEQRAALDARASADTGQTCDRGCGVARHSRRWLRFPQQRQINRLDQWRTRPEGSQPEGLRVTPRRSDSSRVTVNIGETDSQVELKIGQSFDRSTGEVKDKLEGGEVKINKGAKKSSR